MLIISSETVQNTFHFFDVSEAKARFAMMNLSPLALGQIHQFLEKFASLGFMALHKGSDEYLQPIKDLITQFYFVATPYSIPWIKFKAAPDSPLHGQWFYFNHGRSIYPMANPVFDSVTVSGMVRPLIYAWENSENEELLNLLDAEKVDKWPYYRIGDGDHLLIMDMNPLRILEDAPVYTCTLRQLKDVPGQPERRQLHMRQLTQVFGSYAEMLASIDKIQFCSLQYNHRHQWEIPFEEQQAMRKAPGFDRTQRFFTVG